MKEYNVQTISVKSGDVLLVQVSENIDIDDCKSIFNEVKRCFPDNAILIANKRILENLTILHPEDWLEHQNKLSITTLFDKDWKIEI